MNTPPSDSWVIRKKWPKRVLWIFGALIVLYVFPFGVIDEYTDRARVSELIILTGAAREKVESALMESPTSKVTLDAATLIPDALGVKSKDGETIEIAYRDINEKGEIKIFAAPLGAFIILTPTLHDRKISWACWGRPLKITPTSCHGKS